MHFSQRCCHLSKALAKSSSVRVLMTPSYFVLNSSRVMESPASSLFSVGNRK